MLQKNVRPKSLLLIMFLQFFAGESFAQEPLVIGQKLVLRSQILDQDREIWLSLPKSYGDTVFTQKSYPVIYFFDGDSHFETLVAQRNRLSNGLYASMPEVILVGILQKDRTKELTPTAMATPEEWKRADFSSSGGNVQFMDFIEKELKPYIKSNFRTNEFDALIGHSFGGLSVANALITRPDSYDAYVAVDPSMWWDGEKLLNSMDSLWSAEEHGGKIFFLAKANDPGSGEDHHSAILKFNEKVASLNQGSTLLYHYSFYPTEDHGSVVVPGEYDALRFLFEGYQLPVKALLNDTSLLDGHFDAISKKLGYEIIPDEKMIDDLAKVCERQNSIAQAKDLLYRNTQYYPNSERAKKRYAGFIEKHKGE